MKKLITSNKLKTRLNELKKTDYYIQIKNNYPKLLPFLAIPIFFALLLIFNPFTPTPTNENKLQRDLFGSWDYTGQIHAADIKTNFRKTNKGGEIKLTRNNSELQFLIPIEKTKIEKKDNKIVYSSSNNSISAQYEQIKNGIKEEIILNKKPDTNIFMSQLKLKKLNLKVTASGVPIFYGENNQYQFHFAEPFAYDASGNRTNAVKFIIHPIEQTENKVKGETIEEKKGTIKQFLNPQNPEYLTNSYVVEIEVDKNWLNSPDRIYPIVIDPTVVHDEDSEFSGSNFRTTDEDNTSSVEIKTDYQEITPNDPHLAGLWHMNNDWTDSSGNSNDGTASGNASFTTDAKLGSHAGTFDGTGDYVTVSDDDTLDGMSEFTISLWLYHDSINARDDDIFVKGQHGGSQPLAFWRDEDTTDSYAFLVTDEDTDYSGVEYSSFVPESQEWTHLAITFIGDNEAHFYINGKEDSNSPWDMSTIDNVDITTDDLYIGSDSNGGAEFRGDIDELAFYDRALSPEEIKAQAQRRPYGVYTSQVVDLTRVLSWTDLSWSEAGVATGNGETLYDDTNLVAQWNFNENSGTTANNDAEGSSCGGTPSNCDGTLTNFSDTSGQDVAAGSGWTADNARWPKSSPEGLMFDGTDDYIDVGNDTSITTDLESGFTFEVWAKTSYGGDHQRIIDNDYAENSFHLTIDDAQNLRLSIYDGASWNNIISNGSNLDDGKWHHLVGTYDGSDAKVYIDGLLEETSVGIGASFTANNIHIGVKGEDLPGTYTQPFNGVLDSIRIYSRALSANEILANYNAGNIEIQTRTGSDTTPNDGDWEAWKPVSSETQIDAYDDTYLYDPSASGLVSYWPMDEASWTDDCSTDTVTDVAGSNEGHACPNGSGPSGGLTEAKFGRSAYFDGSDDYVDCGNDSSLNLTDTMTVSAWVKQTADNNGYLLIKNSSDDTSRYYSFYLEGENNRTSFIYETSGGRASEIWDLNSEIDDDQWHYLNYVINYPDADFYLDGQHQGTETMDGNMLSDTDNTVLIGKRKPSNFLFDGLIDEVQIYNTALSASTIQELYNEGVESHGINSISNQSDSNIYYEGSGAEKYNTGAPKVDGNTVALYHLDETNGDLAGDDVFDATSNNNDGELAGTTIIDGVFGKARYFDGENDYVDIPASSIPTGDEITISFWAYGDPDQHPVNNSIIEARDSGEVRTVNIHLPWGSNENVYWDAGNNGSSYDRINKAVDSTIYEGRWTHWAFTKNASTGSMKIYVDGKLFHSDTGKTYSFPATAYVTLGAYWDANGGYWPGKIDEFKISDIERLPEEIAAEYQAGKYHRINRTISSTDLTSSTKLPFYIAADEPGTWIETTIGESAFANYMPDENTIGLWRMEESRQSQEEEISSDSTGLDALWHMNNSYTDSSDNSNNGTPSGNPQFTTSSVRGSHAVSFDGSDDYVSTGLTPSNPITVSAWVNIDEYPPGESPDSRGFILRSGAAIYFSIESSGEAQFKMYNGGSNSLNSTYSLNTSQWYHIVGTWDGTTGADSQKLYINGELNNSNAAYSTTYQDDTNGFTIGAQSTTYNHLDGSVDEVAVFNRVLDAEEIEMMYGAKIKDYSGNGNDGGGQGGSITQGKIGKAREFDGDNDYVEVTDFSGYSIYNISAWVNVGEINNSMGAQSIVNFKTTNPQAYLSLGDNSGYATDETITIGDGDSGDYGRTYTRDTYPSGWHYISVNWNSSESRYDIYVDGIAQTVYAGTSAGHARLLTDQDILRIGQSRNSNYLDGIIDELQISNTSRTAEEIRQAYEIGRRTHPITIEFADKLDSNDLLTDSSDPGFRLANEDGQVNKLHEGEKVIVKENYGGTEYIAQGIVDYVDTSSGSVTVSSWDANSTFPSNGFTTEADVFKWQREYWDISGILDSQVNAAIQLTFRITNNGQGRNFWLDDLVYGGAYMSDSTGTSISSTTDRYFQYRAIFSSWDPYVSSSLSSVTLDYTENNSPSTPSNSTPTDGAITETLNPELTASAFSDTDGDAHGASQWQISTSEGSFDSNIVWDSGTTETNLRSIVVNTSNGTFQGALSGATELTDETTYYWRVRYQDDHSNPDWSSYSTITSFTAVDVESTFYCFLEPATDNSQIVVNWTDNNSSEDGYEIERNVNAAGFSHLTTEAANSTSYTDTDVSTGNTYQYRIAPVSGTTTGEWCTTDTVTLGTGDFEFEGINMEGINLD